MKKLIPLCLVAISGCATAPAQPQVQQVPVPVKNYHSIAPVPFELIDSKWVGIKDLPKDAVKKTDGILGYAGVPGFLAKYSVSGEGFEIYENENVRFLKVGPKDKRASSTISIELKDVNTSALDEGIYVLSIKKAQAKK